MEYLTVFAAAAGAWIFGAIWYMVLSKPWMAAAGIATGPDGKPQVGGSALPFVLSAVAMVVVAGFMRHVFSMAGVTGIGDGILAGLGVGLFFISPWIMINNAYAGRTFKLTLIDGGYAVFGCAIIGAVLVVI